MVGADALFAGGKATGATFTYSAPVAGTSAPSVPQPTTLDKESEDERTFLGAYGSAEWRPFTRLSINGGVRLNATSERRSENSPSSNNTRLSGSVGALLGLWEAGRESRPRIRQLPRHVQARGVRFRARRERGHPQAGDVAQLRRRPQSPNSWTARRASRRATSTWTSRTWSRPPSSTTCRRWPTPGRRDSRDSNSRRTCGSRTRSSARATYSAHDGKFVDYREGLRRRHADTARRQARRDVGEGAGVSRPRVFARTTGFFAQRQHQLHRRPLPEHAQHRAGARFSARSTRASAIAWRAPNSAIDARNLGNRRDPVSESEFGDAQYYRMPARSVRAGVVVKY